MKPALRHALAVLPSFVAVAFIAFDSERVLRTGTEVRLAVRAPELQQDGSGRYVRLPLAIGDLATLAGGAALATGDEVFVRVEPGEPAWRAVELLHAPPADEHAVALRGRVVEVRVGTRELVFDVDRYFLPDRGADPSLPSGAHALVAVVRVTPSGACGLAELLVDGVPWSEWDARAAH